MTAALGNVASAAVASLDVDHAAQAQPSRRRRKSIIPQPADLKIAWLTDVSGALLFYTVYNRTGKGQEICVFFF
jgi:hypothetical protein